MEINGGIIKRSSAVGAPGAGAAIGGALGAGAGLLVGNELQNQEVSQAHTDTGFRPAAGIEESARGD